MAIFRYKAVTTDGKPIRGRTEGGSAEAVIQELRQRGVLVTSISRPPRLLEARSRIRPEELMLFSRELGALLKAGIPLPSALALTARRNPGSPLAAAIKRAADDVNLGVSLREAFGREPAFDPMFLNALRLGERNAALPEALNNYYAYQRRRLAVRRKIAQASVYPIILLLATGVIVTLLLGYSLPRFERLYADLGSALPGPTLVVMQLAHALPYIIALVLLAAIATLAALRNEKTRLWFDAKLLSFPIVGVIVQSSLLSQVGRSLSMLLSGGTVLVDALRVTAEMISNRHAANGWQHVAEQVQSGRPFSQAVQAFSLVSESEQKIIEAGEQSGELDVQFAILADYHEELLDARLGQLTALLEPTLMLLVGLIVGGVVIALYLPVFSISGVIA